MTPGPGPLRAAGLDLLRSFHEDMLGCVDGSGFFLYDQPKKAKFFREAPVGVNTTTVGMSCAKYNESLRRKPHRSFRPALDLCRYYIMRRVAQRFVVLFPRMRRKSSWRW
jgi:hypothetical protein